MADSHEEDIDRTFGRLQAKLPDGAASFVRWVRQPSSRWVRIPVGILLIVGGVFSFMPVLGLWMLPLGLLLLAQDLPFLRRPTARVLAWLESRSEQWKRRHRPERR